MQTTTEKMKFEAYLCLQVGIVPRKESTLQLMPAQKWGDFLEISNMTLSCVNASQLPTG